MDKKVRMHTHDHEIQILLFCGRKSSLLASLSGGVKVQLFVSEWETLSRRHSVYLPSKHRRSPVKAVYAEYSLERDTLAVIEVEESEGYR
jgi:hypothetical protein